MKNESIYNFLKSESFIHEDKRESGSFGDYYDLFTKGIVKLRFSSSKGRETVDIGCTIDDDNWYDLALVKALLFRELNLNVEIAIDEYERFIRENISSILQIFACESYSRTRKMLDELENLRIRQMFPDIT